MSYRVYAYEVASGEDRFIVHADEWKCEDKGLIFMRDGDIVAWFVDWTSVRREDAAKV